MATAYVVTAPLVQALVDSELGVYAHFYEGGVLPSNIDKDQLAQLIETKMVEEREVAESTPTEDDGEWKGPKGVNVEDVLAYVADDPELAAEVLEQEQSASKPRVKLVEALEKIADPARD